MYIPEEQDGPVQSQSHVTTDGQSISMSWCLVHATFEGLNPTSGGVLQGEIFHVTIGRATCEACSARWNLSTHGQS
jgi:hypothetical protein